MNRRPAAGKIADNTHLEGGDGTDDAQVGTDHSKTRLANLMSITLDVRTDAAKEVGVLATTAAGRRSTEATQRAWRDMKEV